MLKFLIAPNAFKGSLSAHDAASAIARGLTAAGGGFRFFKLPVADGGDGFAEIMALSLGGQLLEATVEGPLGKPVSARWAYVADQQLAIVETAQASGIKLLAETDREVLNASTFGTGQLLLAALEKGCTRILLGVGGSATVDGGAGILSALGFRLLGTDGAEVRKGGGALANIVRVDAAKAHPQLRNCVIDIACDVENPLLGPEGAAAVFGPQKGASAKDVALLEKGLANWAGLARQHSGIAVDQLKHGGAAGGIAAGLHAFLGAGLHHGTSLVLKALDFETKLKKADVVITGEGKLDKQSLSGKGPYWLALQAKAAGKATIAIAGEAPIGEASDFQAFDAVFSLVNGPMPLEAAMKNTATLLENTAFQVGRLLQAGMALGAGHDQSV